MGNNPRPARLTWPASLDVPALLADGWRPSPFREFIVKVHSRCDLKCDYCYMYEMTDQSWRDQPRAMSEQTADLAASRIADHARAHGLPEVTLILHGGEPLLAGRDLLTRLVTATRRAAGPGVAVHAAIQTNGVGLSEDYMSLFDELGVRVGVSVDGDQEAHDRHRRFSRGQGSYAAVSAGLDRLRRFPHLYGGLLCTVDLRNDPIRTYRALVDFGPPKIDFLLPHGTWLDPPPGRTLAPASIPYADWLTEVFDDWYPKPLTRIRLFEEIMQLLLGGGSGSEIAGLAPTRMVVIETDGSIEQEDTLKAAYP
ncbi:MAG: radical SAM protein, partial [Trebonia sp.]